MYSLMFGNNGSMAFDMLLLFFFMRRVVYMSRLEKYRQIRINKRKFRLSMLMFLIVIITGLCIADYSINGLMKNEYAIEFVSVDKVGPSLYSINIFDYRFLINTEYVEKDFNRVRSTIGSILGFGQEDS